MDERDDQDPGTPSPAADPSPAPGDGTHDGDAPASVPGTGSSPAEDATAPAGEEPSPETPARAPEPGDAREPAPEAAIPPGPASPAAPAPPLAPWAERPEFATEVPRRRLAASSRRDFLVFAAGAAAVAAGAFWLLPDGARRRWFGVHPNDPLDRLAARVGLSRSAREKFLDRALTFDDDVAEALYSKDRRVRTYSTREVTPLLSNWAGGVPGPESLEGWKLTVAGLASGETLRLDRDELLRRFSLHGHVTRFVCVEGWSAVAWFGGVRFADFLEAFPPFPGARWAAIRSELSVDRHGNPDPYYVSIDLDTARHPQALLATHFAGRPLPLAHGAPLRLRVPMKLGLKNIKAITHITYVADEPGDYWAERGYSRYDGL